MKELIRFLKNKLGIDSAIFFTILSRLIQAGSGLISIVFIAKYLNLDEQGYYYTFGSLLSIQIFFELGLTNVIIQFVAHEKVHLKWDSKLLFTGDPAHLSRISSILHISLKWFGLISIILVFVLIVVGFNFFSNYGKHNDLIDWHIPWIIISIYTGLSLLLSSIYAFFEGLGFIKDIAMIRLFQQLLQILLMFLFFFSGMKLFSSPIAALISITIPVIFILNSNKISILKNLWKKLDKWKINYQTEIFPYQWRIALSWISGYFMFQLFNPVAFAVEGAKVAGQMGMTLAVLNGVLSISISWLNTKVPLFSNLIATKDYNLLDVIFNKTLLQISVLTFVCLLLFLSSVFLLDIFDFDLSDRFLPINLIFLLAASTFVNQMVNALATYLRCHKKEPFLIYSIVMAILVILSTFFFGNQFGINGIIISYFVITVIFGFIWAVLIFNSKRREWHKE